LTSTLCRDPIDRMAGIHATLGTEWSLLLTACSALPGPEKLSRLRPLLQQPVPWKQLFAAADLHGLQPLLYQALQACEDAVPADEMRALRQVYQSNLHKALRLSLELIQLDEHLSRLGIEVMPYKGVAAAEVLYGDIALRQAGDIDLLIHSRDLPRIREAVRELGYTPHSQLSAAEERSYLNSGYEAVFDGLAGPNLLELQWAIQPRFYAIEFDMDGLFQRAVPVTVVGHAVQTPCPSDLLLLLSAHAAKHVWGRLVWLCDIAQLMSLTTLDWKWIGSQAKDLGIVRILRVTMLLADRLLGAAVPTAAEESLPEDAIALRLVEEMQPRMISGAPMNLESIAYFRLMMRLRERPADRWRFLQRLALTPGPSEWKAIRLPAPLFPLYRLVRLSRLAARLVRA